MCKYVNGELHKYVITNSRKGWYGIRGLTMLCNYKFIKLYTLLYIHNIMQSELSVFDGIYPDLQKELNKRIIASKIQSSSADDPESNKKKLRTVNYMNAGFEAIYASNIIMLHQVRWHLIRDGKYPDKLEEVDRWLSYINQCNDVNEMLEYFDTHIPIYTSEYSKSIGIEWDCYSIRTTIPFKTI